MKTDKQMNVYLTLLQRNMSRIFFIQESIKDKMSNFQFSKLNKQVEIKQQIFNHSIIDILQESMHQTVDKLGIESLENEFQLMSALKSDDEGVNYIIDPTQKMEMQEFHNKLSSYNKLRLHNKEMLNELKQIDNKLNTQLKNIQRNKETVERKPYIRADKQRSKSVMIKYKELDIVKKQLEVKLLQKTSLQQLQIQFRNLKALYKQKCIQLQDKMKTLKKLKAITESKEQKESLIQKNNSLLSESYITVVKELKQKLKLKTAKVYEQKQKFINESNKRKKTNQSTSATKIRIDDVEKLSPLIEELKVKYEGIGYHIEVLKGQKKNLLLQKQAVGERKKYLERLKMKLS